MPRYANKRTRKPNYWKRIWDGQALEWCLRIWHTTSSWLSAFYWTTQLVQACFMEYIHCQSSFLAIRKNVNLSFLGVTLVKSLGNQFLLRVGNEANGDKQIRYYVKTSRKSENTQWHHTIKNKHRRTRINNNEIIKMLTFTLLKTKVFEGRSHLVRESVITLSRLAKPVYLKKIFKGELL